jgi:hypothetical protein
MASASPARDYDDQDEDEPSCLPSDSADLTPAINCDAAGENGMYGQFTWTVELPAAPADKDSLADISKIRQFRFDHLTRTRLAVPQNSSFSGARRQGILCRADDS